ncbi:MAG: Smr/MutS family protein [Desulfobacterales bacterium]|nr:Smr/MutS family protein [Desulfobacterales bacterium]
MSKTEKNKKNMGKNKKKNDLPVFGSDRDFLTAFLSEKEPSKTSDEEKGKKEAKRLNKHGLPFVEDYESRFLPEPDAGANSGDENPEPPEEEDFAKLLDESFRSRKPSGTAPKPVPLKKRLKRYPPPEADLDLHGFTAIGAEAKAKSFIHTARHQGVFTLRIIVGRGLHSQEGPVLPDVIEDLLKLMKKEKIVLAFEWEGRKKSSSGAVIVYMNQFND